MSKRASGAGGPSRRPQRRSPSRPGGKPPTSRKPSGRPGAKRDFKVVDRESAKPAAVTGGTATDTPAPFRILIAVHRPRFRGRAVRAAALVGWEVTTLLNKQDVVGQV